MLIYVTRRILGLVPVLLAVSIVVFGLTELIPGDPARSLAGENPTPEAIAAIRERLGLDQALPVRYFNWLRDAVQLDLGKSFRNSGTVWDSIWPRLPVTVSLTLVTLVISIVVGVSTGLIAAWRTGGVVDKIVTTLASLGVAVPHFWIGFLLVTWFAVDRRWFPPSGYAPMSEGYWEWLRHLILPSLALAAASAAEISRQTRASVSTVMHEDYIRTARAKGLSPFVVLGKHASRNAAIPVVTVVGLQVSRLIGGAVVIEQIFGIPGLGQLAYQAVFNRDFPVVQGVVMTAAVIVVLVNLAVDLTYGLLNPKLRVTR